MKIRIRNPQGKPLAWREVDTNQPPSLVKDESAGRDIILDWSGALGDDRHIRKCPVCQGTEFYSRKDVPQVTAFVLILVAAAIAVKLFAQAQTKSALIVLGAVVIVDLLIYFFAAKRVICYTCQSEFAGIPIASNQKSWEASTAERYRKLAEQRRTQESASTPAPASQPVSTDSPSSPPETRAGDHE